MVTSLTPGPPCPPRWYRKLCEKMSSGPGEEDGEGDDDDAEDYDDDEGEGGASKAKSSVTTCDENVCESETDSKEEQSSELEGSVFTSDGSDHNHSYEELVEEYAKEDNMDL